jgi:hypothetical protein
MCGVQLAPKVCASVKPGMIASAPAGPLFTDGHVVVEIRRVDCLFQRTTACPADLIFKRGYVNDSLGMGGIGPKENGRE